MLTRNSSHCVDLIKQGGFAGFGPPSEHITDDARYLATHHLVRAILGAGGVGLLGGAGIGLGRMLAAPKTYEPEPSYQSVGIALPRERKRDKVAGDLDPTLPGASMLKNIKPRSVVDSVTKFLYPHIPKDGPVGSFFGNTTSTPWENPALYTLGTLGALGAGYGGYKLTHGLGDRSRKSELDQELAGVKHDYGKLVRRALSNKEASDKSLEIEQELDSLADLCEKQAIVPERGSLAKITPSFMFHGANLASSAFLPFAVLSALGAGKLSYDYFKKRQPQAIAEEALRQRSKERAGGTTPIYMTPLPGGDPV